MSDLIYPFEIKHSSIKHYLQIIKNYFRFIEKNGLYEKKEGTVIYLKFCNVNKTYYFNINNESKSSTRYYLNKNILDITTEKYKHIFLKLKKIINLSSFTKILETLKLKKFSNRVITFVYSDDRLYVSSLYINSMTGKNKLLLLDDLYFYFKDVDYLYSFKLNIQIKERYSKLYNKFLDKIKSESFLIENKLVKFDNIIDIINNKNNKNISFKEFQDIFDNKKSISKDIVFYYLIYFITIYFNCFLNDYFCLEKLDFIILDKESNNMIKVPFKMSKSNLETNFKKELLPPLLPVRF